ncbi:MAG: hypothetical protein ACMG6E_07410 [Candidatus Roizmanbacteria bacterium]
MKEKELDKAQVGSQGNLDLYLGMLDELGSNDKAYQHILSKIKKGIELGIKSKAKENNDTNTKKQSLEDK